MKSSTVKNQSEVEVAEVNDENKKISTSSSSKVQKKEKNSKNGDVKIVEASFDSHCKIGESDEVKILNPKILNTRPVKAEPVKRKSPRLGDHKTSTDCANGDGDGEEEEKEVEFLNVKKIAGCKEKSITFTITSGKPRISVIRRCCIMIIIFYLSFLFPRGSTHLGGTVTLFID